MSERTGDTVTKGYNPSCHSQFLVSQTLQPAAWTYVSWHRWPVFVPPVDCPSLRHVGFYSGTETKKIWVFRQAEVWVNAVWLEQSKSWSRLAVPIFYLFDSNLFHSHQCSCLQTHFQHLCMCGHLKEISRQTFKIQYVRNTLMSKSVKKKSADCWKESLETKTKGIKYLKMGFLFKILNRKSSCIIPAVILGMSNIAIHPPPPFNVSCVVRGSIERAILNRVS